jgi:hypothetical protein
VAAAAVAAASAGLAVASCRRTYGGFTVKNESDVINHQKW